MTKQLKIVLGEDLRERLDRVTVSSGNSLAEEIRQRLERSFTEDDADFWRAEILELLDKIKLMAMLAEITTGKMWNSDPATAYLLKLAIVTHLDRYAEEVTEIPVTRSSKNFGLPASSDPKAIAVALEFMVNFKMSDDEVGFDLKVFRAALEATREHEEES